MSEHPPHRDSDEELEREREESTDLGYRDTEEERAYEEAEGADTPAREGDGEAAGG
jgi:hypothetical protein